MGPVVFKRLVRVEETKVLKIAVGERVSATTMVTRESGAVRLMRSVKAVVVVRFDPGLGVGKGMRKAEMLTRARRVVMTAVTSVRTVGVTLRSVGHRFRCQFAERCVLL